ncbi:MAG: hypothetical protein OEM52_03775 [bacterium]|nr:hypothetical protein [bacterium]
MIHPDEMQLLAYQLETLEDAASREVASHVRDCPDCQKQVAAIKNEISLLSGVSVPVTIPPIPLPMPKGMRKTHSLLRVAAVLLIGFTIGYSTSEILRQELQEVNPQYTAITIPPDSMQYRFSSEAVDLAVHIP